MNPEPRTSLQRSRVWLTGASSGIGAALVTKLVERGARVAITARRVDLLESIASRGSSLLVVPADVTDAAAVAAAVRRIESEWGGIDLAIFNAGGSVAPSEGREPKFVAHEYVSTMALNYSSVVYGVEAVLPGMLARGSGHIAAVASLAGYRPSAVALPYSVSKAAVIHLMEGLRLSVAGRGVTVTVINPGFVKTPLTARHTFRMPFLIEADDAAERIVRGLERGKGEIHFPAPLSWTVKLLRMLPDGVYARIIRRAAPR
jgi:NADP-dependent 3-hydroxy acid dehydrogenase YdfG